MGYVQQQDAFLEQISGFGEEFAGCCMQLNNLCVAFYSFVSNHIFIHEKEWTEALHAFRESVFKSAEGTRTQRLELYNQITTILLNPAATVKHSSGQFGQISRRLSQLLQQGSSNPSSSQKCVACGKTGGVMTECSGRRCTALFHIPCAASTLSSKKFKTNFYRCSKCSAVEIKPVKPRKKRNRTDSKPNIVSASGESDGDDCQDASAAAAFSPFSNQSSSHDECSAAKAPTAHPSSSDDDECSGAKHATAPASTPAVDQHPISTFPLISSSTSADNHLTVLTDITEILSALHCAQGELSSLQLISQAVPSIPQQNVSLFRSIVREIRDKLSKLTALVVNVENVEPTVYAFQNSLLEDAFDAVGTVEDAIEAVGTIENAIDEAVDTIHSPLSGDDFSFFLTETSVGHSTAQPLLSVKAVIESQTPSVMETPAAPPTAAWPSTSASATDFRATFPPSVSPAMSLALMSSASGAFGTVTRLPLEGWLEMEHMTVCIGMFGVLNRDTLWILPHHCDSIILNLTNSSGWSRFFTRYISNHKFNYVVAFVNVNGGIVDRFSRYNDPGVHWIVSVGNVSNKTAWNYDPQGTQMKHCRGLDILSAVVSHKTASVFKFVQVNCPFQFQCQRSSDREHCGVWCLMFTLNWCTRTLREYEDHVTSLHEQSKVLTEFAVNCRLHFNADLEQGVVDKTSMFWNSPKFISDVSLNDSFWTVTNQMRLDCFLRDKYQCDFQEQKHLDGRLQPLSFGDMQEGNPWEAVHFYAGTNRLVKVYRILLGARSSSTTDFLAQALHEASATAYVCSRKNWHYQIFGVVTRGTHTSYVHVCIVRSLLCASSCNAAAPRARSAIVDLVRSLGLVHGDPHIGNAKATTDSPDIFEVIDFERSFLLSKKWQSEHGLITSIVSETEQYFDGNLQVRIQLLAKMAKMGVTQTRNRFQKMCANQLSILNLGLNDFLECFDSGEM